MKRLVCVLRVAAPMVMAAAIAPTVAIAQAVNIVTVPVGNAGNAADPATGSVYGSVGYNYNIGKYDGDQRPVLRVPQC
jgi:hypothetical protein